MKKTILVFLAVVVLLTCCSCAKSDPSDLEMGSGTASGTNINIEDVFIGTGSEGITFNSSVIIPGNNWSRIQ